MGKRDKAGEFLTPTEVFKRVGKDEIEFSFPIMSLIKPRKNQFGEEEVFLYMGEIKGIEVYLKLTGNLLIGLLSKLRKKNLWVTVKMSRERTEDSKFSHINIEIEKFFFREVNSK